MDMDSDTEHLLWMSSVHPSDGIRAPTSAFPRPVPFRWFPSHRSLTAILLCICFAAIHMMNCNLSMSVVCMINSTEANRERLSHGETPANITHSVFDWENYDGAPLVNWTPEEEGIIFSAFNIGLLFMLLTGFLADKLNAGMCGIWALAGGAANLDEVCPRHREAFMRIVGRGPDYTTIEKVAPAVHLGFHRLAIVMPGDQPSQQPIVGNGLSVVCNGEIYNHKAIKDEFPMTCAANGGSDCAAIVHSFVGNKGDLKATCASLDGVFAFVMADADKVYIGRDPLGVRPLFYGFSADGGLLIGSEVKCISELCERIEYFPPGCCATFIPAVKTRALQIHRYWTLPTTADRFDSMECSKVLIRDTLVRSVEKRLMGNRHFGFMLSGGLDSSLIASIATRFLQHKPHAFSVGFEDSPDLENARIVAEYLNIPHHVIVITPQQCIDIIPEVVNALETFDPLIIRCGIAHYLLCKHIAETSDVKVLLSGEGADELFGSYAYMQRAPNAFHLHKEIRRRLLHLHQYDVLRCDRSTSCHGLEIRVPFLDKEMIDLCVRLPPTYKLIARKLEKFLLRSAFEGWVPDEVLWRSKEGFAEALGKTDLGEIVHEHANKIVSDEEFKARAEAFPDRPPESKEEYWYRTIFEACYPLEKIAHVVHTKVYKTAAWHLTEEKENIALGKKATEEDELLRRKAPITSGVVA